MARNPFLDAKTYSSPSTAHVNERRMQRWVVDQKGPPIFWRDGKSPIFWSTRANARSCTLALSFGWAVMGVLLWVGRLEVEEVGFQDFWT